MAREIRNARAIDFVNNNQMQLSVWDEKLPYNPDDPVNNILNENAVGTILYQYQNQGNFLLKTVTYPGVPNVVGRRTFTKELFRNMMVPPSATNFIFRSPTQESSWVECLHSHYLVFLPYDFSCSLIDKTITFTFMYVYV